MKQCTYSYWIFGLSLLVTGCAINPVTGERDFVTVSESDEIAQGTRYHQSIIAQYGVYDDPALQAYVNQIGQTLAAKSHRQHLNFHFTLLDSPDINAFALPGGYVYITRGIMAYLNSEAEIAGVLGHEIGHVTARHSVRQQSGQFASNILNVLVTAATGDQTLGQLSNQLTTGIVRGYGRDHELEADRLGAEYLHMVGYNPESMLEVIGVLKNQEIYEKALAKKQNREANIYHGVFSTHPKNDKRLKTVVRAAKNLSSKSYRDNNSDKYMKMIDGVSWGQNIKQGVVVNNRFLHPELGFGIQFPQNWQVTNSADALIARDFDNGAILQMTLLTLDKGESLPDLLRRQSSNQKLSVKTHSFGASATTTVTIGDTAQPARISALKLSATQAVFVIGTSSTKTFAKTDSALLEIDQSYTRLSNKQIAEIKSPKLQIINAKSGDSFAALAKKSAINYDAESVLRLLNRAFPKGDITVGKPLKIITTDE